MNERARTGGCVNVVKLYKNVTKITTKNVEQFGFKTFRFSTEKIYFKYRLEFEILFVSSWTGIFTFLFTFSKYEFV